MRISIINTYDIGGGAEKDALTLCKTYQNLGHSCHMLVKEKRSNYPFVSEIADYPISNSFLSRNIWKIRNGLRSQEGRIPGVARVRSLIRALADLSAYQQRRSGMEDFDYPGTFHAISEESDSVQIYHLHNLHGNYFDLRVLPTLRENHPIFLTLHDQWTFTGHCAYSFKCERWKIGCGSCPDLSIYPPVKKDATDRNWLRKKSIYDNCRFYISTPSRWLFDQVHNSILASSAVEMRVIPYGINLEVFQPADKERARRLLNIQPQKKVILLAANRIKKNEFKDFQTLYLAMDRLSLELQEHPLIFLVLGETAPNEQIKLAEVRYIPYQSDPGKVASYFQAADLYLHAARADNFPFTVLEALACGTPVVATGVGGIPEQIQAGTTGFLVPMGDHEAMANHVGNLIANEGVRTAMSENAARDAKKRFDVRREVRDYLDWYEEVLNKNVNF